MAATDHLADVQEKRWPCGGWSTVDVPAEAPAVAQPLRLHRSPPSRSQFRSRKAKVRSCAITAHASFAPPPEQSAHEADSPEAAEAERKVLEDGTGRRRRRKGGGGGGGEGGSRARSRRHQDAIVHSQPARSAETTKMAAAKRRQEQAEETRKW